MKIIIKKDPEDVGAWVAQYTINKINAHAPTKEKPFILGLPTGSSPVPTYKEFIRMHKEGKLSFENIITFNMDEYVDLPEDHPESYHYFMYKYLFDHVDIPPENINFLDGNAPDLEKVCSDYEEKIRSYGGVNLFLGGIGADGHIAFNEPGSSLASRTRIKTLSYETILDNSRFFSDDMSKVPTTALTVGVGTVMDAEEVLIIITGYSKARALRWVVEGSISHMWTVSALQMHPKGIIVCDDDATMELQVETVKYFKDIETISEKRMPGQKQ